MRTDGLSEATASKWDKGVDLRGYKFACDFTLSCGDFIHLDATYSLILCCLDRHDGCLLLQRVLKNEDSSDFVFHLVDGHNASFFENLPSSDMSPSSGQPMRVLQYELNLLRRLYSFSRSSLSNDFDYFFDDLHFVF